MHFNITKPQSNDYFSLGVMNDNYDEIDDVMYANQQSAAKVMVGATSLADGESGRVPAPASADRTKYLKGDGTWDTPSGGGGGGSSTLDGLDDVNITSPTNGQVLKYNSTSHEWENANESGGGGGSSVTITSTLSSGTKIADYSIDGVSNSLYAPSGGSGGGSTFETVFAGSKSTSSWNSPLVFNEFDVTAYDIIRITAALDGDSYVWLLDTDIIPVKPANKLHILGEAYCDRDNTSFEMYVSSSHNLSVSKIEGLVEGTGSSMVHYSTTEHQVGTWIDGSDLYEKTIYFTATNVGSPSDNELTSLLAGDEDIIDSQGYVDYIYQSEVERFYVNSRYTWIYNNRGTYYLSFAFGSATLDSVEAYITIRYTKTGGNS